MIRLAWKNSLLRPVRTGLILLTIAAIVAEILLIEAFMAGSYAQMRQAVLRRGGDVMVSQEGVSNFLFARSMLPQQTRAAVESVPGVSATYPLATLPVVFEQGERRSPMIILVYDDLGGPLDIVDGRAPQTGREIVIDRALAQRFGLGPGDTLAVAGFDFTVAGISSGDAAMLTPFGFITFDGLIEFYFESDIATDLAAFPLVSFLAVDAEPDVEPSELAATLNAQVADVHAALPGELALNDEALGRDLVGPIMRVLRAVSYGIGALSIGLFMFAAVRRQRRNLGVLRALGFAPRHFITGVVAEAIVTVLAAIPLGIVLAIALAALIEWVAPAYLLLVAEPSALARTTAVALMLAVLGALAPLRVLMRLDPAMAFRV